MEEDVQVKREEGILLNGTLDNVRQLIQLYQRQFSSHVWEDIFEQTVRITFKVN